MTKDTRTIFSYNGQLMNKRATIRKLSELKEGESITAVSVETIKDKETCHEDEIEGCAK